MCAASFFRTCKSHRRSIEEKLNITQNFSPYVTCNTLLHYEFIRLIWRQTVAVFMRIIRNASSAWAECRISNFEARVTYSYHGVVKCVRCNIREMFIFRMHIFRLNTY